MPLDTVPNEILLEIGDQLDTEHDLYYLTRVSKRFYHLFVKFLYRHNIQRHGGDALFWAAKHGRETTARRLLEFEAELNGRDRTPSSPLLLGCSPKSGMTPLHQAAHHGHLCLVKLLLKYGADSEAQFRNRFTPVYAALASKHEKVARTISRRMINLADCMIDVERRLTPLHLSCMLGLWKTARFFLMQGGDVNAVDLSGQTPLHYALR